MSPTQVMVVEDEALVGIDIQNNLTNYGYNVVGVSNSGREAINEAVKSKPEIVLMDIQLKGEMDGIETAKFLRKTLGIPVIYLTAYSDDMTLTKALKASPYGYLLKPFVPRELHTSIQAALHRSEDDKKIKLERLKYLQNNIIKKKELQLRLMELQSRSVKKEEDKKIERLKYIRHNILRRKEFESKLREQSNFLNKMKELLNNLCYIQDTNNNPRGVFPLEEFADVLGYSKDEILRMGSLSVPVLIHPDDFPRIEEYFQKKILSEERVFEIEFRLKHKNGDWKWFSNRSTFLDEETTDKKTLNIVREITKTKSLEESFFMTQEKLQAISSNPYLGVAILDREGKILDMNSTLQRLSGYNRNELMFLSTADFMSLKGIRAICENLQRMRTGEIKSFQVETIVYPKHNGAFWAYMVFSSVHNMDGMAEYITCSLIDISETKLFEKLGGSSRTKP